MTGFIADGQPMESSLETANEGYFNTPSSGAEAFSSQNISGGGTALDALSRSSERHASDLAAEGYTFNPNSPEVWQKTSPAQPKMTADDINQQYGPIGPDGKQVKITDEPMYENTAKLVAKAKADELDREGVWSRYTNAHPWYQNMAVGLAGQMTDPLNIASGFVPGLGEESILAKLGAAGYSGFATRTAARVAAGASGAAAVQVPLTALQYGLGQQEASDYSLRDAFKDMAFGAAGGAILHAGFGALGDVWKSRGAILNEKPPAASDPRANAIMDAPAQDKSALMKSSVSQIVNGQPVNPEAVKLANLPLLAEQQKQLYRSGFSPGMSGQELDAATEQLLPKEQEGQSRIEQPVIDRYKKTISDEAKRIGIPLDDEGLNRAATAMAESHGIERANQLTPEQQEISDLEGKLNPAAMTQEERGQLDQSRQFAADADEKYNSALKAWTDCLAGGL